MAQIATPDEVLLLFSACEAAYADASQKGYADNPNVVGAVADLKSAYRVLVIANASSRRLMARLTKPLRPGVPIKRVSHSTKHVSSSKRQ